MRPELLMIGVLVLIALTIGVTVLAAILVWRNGYTRGWQSANHLPPVCKRCGYNLSGLRQCLCPECGTEFVLDQLWRTPNFGRSAPEQAPTALPESAATEQP